MRIHDRIWIVKALHKDKDLSYMTYVGPKSALEKRKETGRSWAMPRTQKWDANLKKYVDIPFTKPPEFEYENEPLEGFFIAESVARWSTQNKLFRVRDPRGFVVEVPTGNISTLLKYTTVSKGFIQEKCLWGREGPNHVLIPDGSDYYKDAMKHEKKMRSGKISGNQMNSGDLLQDGHGNEFVYIGRYKISYRVKGTLFQSGRQLGFRSLSPSDYKEVYSVDSTSNSQGVHLFCRHYKGDFGPERHVMKVNPKLILISSKKYKIDIPSFEKNMVLQSIRVSSIPSKVGQEVLGLTQYADKENYVSYFWKNENSSEKLYAPEVKIDKIEKI